MGLQCHFPPQVFRKLHVCLDPKDLNRALMRAHHKTPMLEEITHKLHGATVFSKLDAKNRYWSVELDKDSQHLTTFNSPFGRFCFTRLPYGLVVSQDVFQRRMDLILEQCPGTIGIANDVTVYGEDDDDHNKNLLNLMEVARREGLVFNSAKCVIKVPRINFFGLIFDKEGVHPDPSKVEAILSLPPPKDVTELQQFIVLVTYLSPVVPRLSQQ